jgi:hypothetical protein
MHLETNTLFQHSNYHRPSLESVSYYRSHKNCNMLHAHWNLIDAGIWRSVPP